MAENSAKIVFESKERGTSKCRTTFNLTETQYEDFKSLCKMRGFIPSDIVDLLIKDFNNSYKSEIEEIKGNSTQPE